MIVGILNGYYRTGTTIIYKILRDGWKDGVVLYEPLHPELDWKVTRNAYEEMHGDYVWSEYHKLNNIHEVIGKYIACRETYYKRWEEKGMKVIDPVPFPSEYKIFKDYLKMFEESDQQIILQTNRFHFILNKFKRTVHINRDRGNTFLSHLKTLNRKKIVNILCKINPRLVICYYNLSPTATSLFYVEDNYQKLLYENYISYPAPDNIIKFNYVYCIFNTKAYSRAKNVITYESLVKNPFTTLEIIEETFQIELKNKEELAKRIVDKNTKCGYKLTEYLTQLS